MKSVPITVLDLRDSPWVDGPGRTILDCAETIDQSRARIIIGAFDGGSPDRTAYEQEARRRGLEVFRVREKRSFDLGVLRQLIELARRTKADLIHGHDFRSDAFGLVAAKRLRLPFVATAHGWIANDFKGRIRTGLDRLILRRADHVITVSDKTRSSLGQWADGSRCTVIPNALRCEMYQPNRRPGAFRAEHGITDQELLIANIGRLSPEKGQAEFLVAAKEIARKHRHLRFALFGIGADLPKLKRFVADNEMEKLVIFAGYNENMAEIYDEIDLVVQSSSTEGMPNVVIEALLMEVPVVATDVGGTREVLRHGQTGVLIPSGEREPLVASIDDFIANRERFANMASEGRKDMLMRFDHTRRVARLADVYEKVISARRGCS